ncbi:MAG: phasin superfamily protein [Desulfuromonadales bacterium]|nr:phasin superfamily protein [Desulfuromonadales bacterium]
MLEFAEKTLLAGIGALSLTQKKGDELLQELKERLDLTEEEGKKLLSRLESVARENQAHLEEVARDEVKKACQRVGLVSSDEFEKLKKKVTLLEKQLKSLKKT